MSKVENHILNDRDPSLFCSDEPMVRYNGDKNDSSVIDEMHQLLGDTSISEAKDFEVDNADYDFSFVENNEMNSALEKLDELYGVSLETDSIETTAVTEETVDNGITDSASLMEEMEALFSSSAETDDANIDDKTSIEETYTYATDTDLLSDSNILEELEAMLDEISVSGSDKNSDDIKISGGDLSYEEGIRREAIGDIEEKLESDNEPYVKLHAVGLVTDKTKVDEVSVNTSVEGVNEIHEQGNNRVLKATLLFFTVLAAGSYGYSSLLSTGDGKNIHSEQSVIQDFKSVSDAASEESLTKDISAGVDTIYALLEKMEASVHVPISYELEQLTTEVSEPDRKDTETQNQYIGGAEVKPGNRLKDVTGIQMEELQQENKGSLKPLDGGKTEAESPVVHLQEEKATAENGGFAEPVRPALAEVAGKESDFWTVHISSYYGKPPPASELKYLEKAGISYEIKKAMINEKVWYRVIVDEFSEYEKAKQFSDDIIKNVLRKDVWINKG